MKLQERLENEMLLLPEKTDDCRICAIGRGDAPLGPVDQPWLSSERYTAFTSLGALVPGWSLVAPKRHVLNMAADYSDPELLAFLEKARESVESIYGRTVYFEHGPQKTLSATSCGTSHAHLHIVPLSFSLTSSARLFDAELEWKRCRSADIAGIVGENEYLFAADEMEFGVAEGFLAILSEGRSQFFRQVIANKLGRELEYNYRLHPQLKNAEATASALNAGQHKRAKAA